MRNSLRWRREAKGLTQAELADRIGVSRRTIISLEQDRSDPSLPLAFRLARELGVRVDELFELDDNS